MFRLLEHNIGLKTKLKLYHGMRGNGSRPSQWENSIFKRLTLL